MNTSNLAWGSQRSGVARCGLAVAIVTAICWAKQATAEAAFSFETGIQNWTSIGGVASQNAFGATDGAQALFVGGIQPGYKGELIQSGNFGPATAGYQDAYEAFALAASVIEAGGNPTLNFDFTLDTSAVTTPAWFQLGLVVNSQAGYLDYGTGSFLGGNLGTTFPYAETNGVNKAGDHGTTITPLGPNQYRVAVPFGPGKKLTLAPHSTYYFLRFQSNGGYVGDLGLAFDNIHFTGVPVYESYTMFSWETPDNPATPGEDERFEGWKTTIDWPTPPPGVTLAPGHVHSIVTTGATDGAHALQLDRRSVVGNGGTPETDAFVWGSVYAVSSTTDPSLAAGIADKVARINGAARIAFDVTFQDQYNPPVSEINPTFTNFYIHFADDTGVFYQAATPGIEINGAAPGTMRTLEIPIENFIDAISGTKTLAADGLSPTTTALEVGIASNTDYGAVYQIDNFRIISEVVEEPFNPADFNEDTAVDGDDLAEWKSSYGPANGADADDDGDSDGNDFLIWQRNIGAGASSTAVAAVPEPSALLLYAMGVTALFVGGKRR